jgi:hypothetical protein
MPCWRPVGARVPADSRCFTRVALVAAMAAGTCGRKNGGVRGSL